MSTNRISTLLAFLLVLQHATTCFGFTIPSFTRQETNGLHDIRQNYGKTRAGSVAKSSAQSSALYASSEPSSETSPSISLSSEASLLKSRLFKEIDRVKELQEIEGDFSVDFGVKGGELNSTSRAPQKLDFYSISENVGKAADKVFETVNLLAESSPTPNVTEYWGDKARGSENKLNGQWNLLFSTAADATFSKNSTRGDAKAMNVVTASRQKIINVIQFLPGPEEKKERLVSSLRVRLKATAEGLNRINLTFKYVMVKFNRLFFLPLKWTLILPVPGTFITRILFFMRKSLPKAYFDVLYLDEELRIHKTGEDNLFIQKKEASM
ncbi:hypothetical protein TrVE_jg10992 [Triparma verrucosa]|uniref:Plastid lipid-associated protein/fibrillin conserved domain-containing protein n=1 Tax=Triparma verrucosa TaxID=1606542 RepID=A0A9W7EZ94_9STRA|nr:hypothetical protein TrVE_jg10992 [Triparma verrucosa]